MHKQRNLTFPSLPLISPSKEPCTCLSLPLGGSDILLHGCALISMLQKPRVPLAVPTVRGVVAYSVEFINLFGTPIESAWQPLEITP